MSAPNPSGLSSAHRIRARDLAIQAALLGLHNAPAIHYTNAKVVLVGKSGTGKTWLAQALMGQPPSDQGSTHGMKVWMFQSETSELPNGGEITRETFLWDLAGQSDYRVVHQLFLDETALGLVLFDPSDHENPFGGVGYWEKSLRRVVKQHDVHHWADSFMQTLAYART